MSEPTRSPESAELEKYIAEAQRLRSEELARIGRRLFRSPGHLLRRARHQGFPRFGDTSVGGTSVQT